jgi:hypothetical protein
MPLCNANSNKTISCAGDYMPSEGCCLKHSVLFDFWIADRNGAEVYESEQPRSWKRAQFHKWLDSITEDTAKAILDS